MARAKTDLSKAFALPADEDQASTEPDATEPDATDVDEAPKQAKKSTTKSAKKATSSPRKQAATKTAKKATKPPQKRAQTATGSVPTVRVPASTGEAKRVHVGLHEDDFRDLAMAKVDDGADANARLRAMIAVWREVPRFRQMVDRVARTAPRGGSIH